MELSPYTPGAGHRPPILAGRERLIRIWQSALNDVAVSGRTHAPDIILKAPRGVGKTATVLSFEDLCRQQGFEVISVQASRGNATLVDSLLQRARSRAEDGAGPWERARRAFERVASVNVSVLGVGGGVSTHARHEPQAGPVSPEDLAEALATLDREVRRENPRGGVLLTVDEIQAASSSDLTLLSASLQELNKHHPDAHVMFAGSGLPNTEEVLDAAGVTHPDRLFDVHPVELLLHPDDARYAVVEAARERGVSWEPAAADRIVQASSGYPAHLQVFADETWRAARGPGVITTSDAQGGIENAAATLERRSLGPRFDRMSDRQREFVTGLAVLGGQASMSDLAITLGRPRGSLSELRDTLITEGDVYSPRRGEIALTAPVFGPYLRANYEEARGLGNTKLLPLEEMERNVEAIDNVRRSRDIQAPLTPNTLQSGVAAQLPSRAGPAIQRPYQQQAENRARRSR